MAPFLLAQLSDPHVGEPGSVEGLERTVRAIAALDPLPQALLVTGDVAADGRPEQYERAHELLAALAMPVHALVGNHDDRVALRERFPASAGDGGAAGAGSDALYAYATGCGPLRLVACDTLVPGQEGGSMDAARLAWLEAQLAADPRTPTIVALHHPPIPTGVRPLDEIGLPAADGRALGELLARSPQVVRLVAGHVHRASAGTLGGRPVFTCPSTYLQAKLDFGDPGELALVPEPPAFALHALLGGELVTHVQTVA